MRERIGRVQGGKSKKMFSVLWDTETKRVYVEQPGFFGSTVLDTKSNASRAEMAMHTAEAFLYNK